MFVIALAGCASHPEPLIDTQGVNPAQYERDLADCNAYGEQVRIEQGVAKGAVAGSAVGAASGAVLGDAGTGAALGAIGGGARSAQLGAHEQAGVIKRCMRLRGYRVLN
jgi:outer membrane lipoprotein SlyB